MDRKCYKCGQLKPATVFGGDRSRPDGLTFVCTPCRRAIYRLNALSMTRKCIECSQVKGRELFKELARRCLECEGRLFGGQSRRCRDCKAFKDQEEYAANPTRKGGRDDCCRECRARQRTEPIKNAADRARCKRNARKLRMAALVRYSGPVPCCACCREANLEFLQIDHINGGGTAHIKELFRQGMTFYRWLHGEGYPEGFRVLCSNCNFSLGHYGYCPHERHRPKAAGRPPVNHRA